MRATPRPGRAGAEDAWLPDPGENSGSGLAAATSLPGKSEVSATHHRARVYAGPRLSQSQPTPRPAIEPRPRPSRPMILPPPLWTGAPQVLQSPLSNEEYYGIGLCSDHEYLPLSEFIVMGEEFRIGSGAQFVPVRAMPRIFRRNALRTDAIEEPVQAISQWQNEPQKSGNTLHLCEHLPTRCDGGWSGDGGHGRRGEPREEPRSQWPNGKRDDGL